MPTINLTRILEIALKIAIFGAFVTFFVSYIGDFTVLLSNIVNKITMGNIDNLNLGCFAEKIGMVSFINSLFIIAYNAVGVYISALLSVLVYRFVLKIYTVIFSF